MDTVEGGARLLSSEEETAAPHVPLQNLSARLRPVARAFRAKPFVPHKLFGSGHAQTTYAALRLSRPRRLRDAGRDFEPRLVEVEPGARRVPPSSQIATGKPIGRTPRRSCSSTDSKAPANRSTFAAQRGRL